MTADGHLPPDQRRNYKHVFDALFRISREEGVHTLWRGAITTMGRAIVVNVAQLASYSQAKEGLYKTGNTGLSLGQRCVVTTARLHAMPYKLHERITLLVI